MNLVHVVASEGTGMGCACGADDGVPGDVSTEVTVVGGGCAMCVDSVGHWVSSWVLTTVWCGDVWARINLFLLPGGVTASDVPGLSCF